MGVLDRVDDIDTRSEYRHRPPAAPQRAAVGGSVNAPGQATHRRPTGSGQGVTEPLGEAHAVPGACLVPTTATAGAVVVSPRTYSGGGSSRSSRPSG